MNQITPERKQEMIKRFETNEDLFNWCEEYNTFVDSNVQRCVSSEWEFMLKESIKGNTDSPIDYKDLDLFDTEMAKEQLFYHFEDNTEEWTEEANTETYGGKVTQDIQSFIAFLDSLNKDELKNFYNYTQLDLSDAESEIYEWWIISDPLLYRLEKAGEIILAGAWGRQTTGQSIKLDNCVVHAFINWLKGD